MLELFARILPRLIVPAIILLSCALSPSTCGAETVDYARNIKPLLAARCYSCHGGLKQKSGLRVDTVELMKKGGKNGPIITPGNSGKSLIIEHVTNQRDAARMPPETEGE